MKKTLLSVVACASVLAASAQVTLTPIGSYHTGVFDASASEIIAYNAEDELVYSTNAYRNRIDIIDLSDPTNPVLEDSILLSPYGGGVNSVAFYNGVVAAAVEANDPQTNGVVAFFQADGTYIIDVEVGAMPDMITFSPDGMKVLTANEGEPNDAYTVDPVGSVSIIDVSGGIQTLQQSDVTTVDFSAFNAPAPLDPNIRIYGPNASVAQDLEPEYITVTEDSQLALVVCQENNAIAGIDLNTNTILGIQSLGYKDYSLSGNEFDASNQDGAINIQNWPVFGMYQPDAIDNYTFNGSTYIVSANEGDSRDYSGFSEETRVRDMTLDETAFPNSATLQLNENLGRLNVTVTLGDAGADNDYDQLYSYGARSFSIWDLTGNLIYDSGNDFETFMASYDAANFNSNNDDNTSFDSRSDDKGPEPEALKVVSIMGKTYAFIGLERQGGVMVYDITDPNNVSFESYATDRDFTQTEGTPAAGGLGPEDIKFVEASESPTGFPLLLVSNEVSGSISVYGVSGLPEAAPLVITEIMYNPAESGTDSTEFIEIYNPTALQIALDGYFFREGVEFTFPENATIDPFGFVITAVDADVHATWFGNTAYEWTGGATSNGGEDIVLAAPSGAVADSVEYDDVAPWPGGPNGQGADGGGYSIVLCDPFSDNNDGSNWSLSTTNAGFIIDDPSFGQFDVFADPGSSNCFTVGLDEIITTAVKLYPNPNNGNFFIDLAGVNETTMVQVYNATGQLVEEFSINSSGQVAISENLQAGIYHVVVSNAGTREAHRMVVLK